MYLVVACACHCQCVQCTQYTVVCGACSCKPYCTVYSSRTVTYCKTRLKILLDVINNGYMLLGIAYILGHF